MTRRFLSFLKRYKGEIIITLAANLITFILTNIRSILLGLSNPNLREIFFLQVIIFILVFILLFHHKRLISTKFEQTNKIFMEHFGYSLSQTLYAERLGHFTQEKQILAKSLVYNVLPNIITRISSEHSNLSKINIILDSGTTITPVFPHLLGKGLPQLKKIKIYTNNLAGINEIHKLEYLDYGALSSRDFILIGGQPLNKYRATTGKSTQDFLRTIWEERNKDEGKIVTIGVLTANWFLGGPFLNEIAICARGEGHFDFKTEIIENSDYLIFVAPLGKILRINDIKVLNSILPTDSEEYRHYTIPARNDKFKIKETYLFTSLRPRISSSPLATLSFMLKDADEKHITTNYIVCKESPEYHPHGDKGEVMVKELPHLYTRSSRNFEKIYGYPLP